MFFFSKKNKDQANKQADNTQPVNEQPVNQQPIEVQDGKHNTAEHDTAEQSGGWLTRLRAGLARSANNITDNLKGVFTKKRLDAAMLSELEQALIRVDLGQSVATRIVQEFGRERLDKDISEQDVRKMLAAQIADILQPCAVPLRIDSTCKPFVVLFVGVNGNGKTTTLGKIAAQWQREGHKVALVACDTFRAAAVEQLTVWGDRAGCQVITAAANSDPAALAFSALAGAKEAGLDALLIDTAGRLHNRSDLMEELAKIVRVLKKQDPSAPHAVVLVLDATTGQNAISQVETFHNMADVTGLVVTKLDGTARGGVLVALAEKFKLPVHAIGVGEGIDDLRPFNPLDFAGLLL